MKKTYFALGLLCALCVFTAAVAVKAVGGFTMDNFRVETDDSEVKIVKEKIIKRIVEGETGETIETTAASEKLAPFKAVRAYGPMEIVYRQGDDYIMELSGASGDFSHISSKVTSDGLVLRCDKNKVAVLVTITAPTLEQASLMGSGGFTAEKFRFDKFQLQSQGSGDIRLTGEVKHSFALDIMGSGDFSGNIDAPEAKIGLSGSGDARLEGRFDDVNLRSAGSGDAALIGKTNRLNLQIQGSGEVKANQLRAADGNVALQGSGDCFVNVTDRLTVSIQGSGDVRYTGSPKITSAIKGSGTLEKE